MSLTVYSYAHKKNVRVSALIDPAMVGCGDVHPVTRSYRVNSGAPAAYKNHNGLDICSAHKSPVYSISDGVVRVNSYEKNGAGYYVSIGSAIDGKDYHILYMHLNEKSCLKKGAKISKGDLIGYQGSTGNSTGSHLHISVKRSGKYCDPYYFAVREDWDTAYTTGKYRILCNILNIRDKPSLSAKQMDWLSCGNEVEIDGLSVSITGGAWGHIRNGGWCCIKQSGKDAFAELI